MTETVKRKLKNGDWCIVVDGTHKGKSGIAQDIKTSKTGHITIIQKDGRLFSVSTIPPTQENKELTEKILATFDFQ